MLIQTQMDGQDNVLMMEHSQDSQEKDTMVMKVFLRYVLGMQIAGAAIQDKR